jgi:uncharacterized protein
LSRSLRHPRSGVRQWRNSALLWLLPLMTLSPSVLSAEPTPRKEPVGAIATREIDWQQLVPPGQAMTVEQMMGEIDHFGGRADPVDDDARAVAAMNGVTGTLTGYIVPIVTDSRRRIVELFLVPYYGACIHVPPPPPNQIIYIKLAQPLPADELWDAYRVTGTLRILRTANETATAIYAMDPERLEQIADSGQRRYSWLVDGIIILTFLGFLFAYKAIARWYPPRTSP